MIKTQLHKSYFMKETELEETFFYISGDKGIKFSLGYGQDRYGRPRDYYNFTNEISLINYDAKVASDKFDATTFSTSKDAQKKIDEYIASTPYNFDKENLAKNLEFFISNSEKEEDIRHFIYCLRDIENSTKNGLKGLSDNAKNNCLNYVRDTIDESISPTGKNIKSVNDRRNFWSKVRGKDEVHGFFFDNLGYSILKLSGTEYANQIKELYKDGFPDLMKVEEAFDEGKNKLLKVSKNFDYKKHDEVRKELFNQYAVERIQGAMQLKYYEETKDLSIFLSDKEQEEFKSMTFKDLKEKYGTDLITTHKGAALLTHKLHEEKSKGQDISSSLVELKEIAKKSHLTPNNDITLRRYIFDELKKDYQKFATDDMEYRAVIEELAPSKTERAYLNKYLKEKDNNEEYIDKKMALRLVESEQFYSRFTQDSDLIITGKIAKSDIENIKANITDKKKEETVKQAIKRVREKHESDKKTGENISGVVIADDIASRIQEGFEFPKSKEKRDVIVSNLRKKRATTKSR